MEINFERIPEALKNNPQWVLWKYIDKGDGKATKVPFQTNGKPASSTNAATWNEYHDIEAAYQRGGYTGIGFVFLEDGGLCGIDLDGCRDPENGAVSEWAKKIITELDTYAEVSPSLTGVKLFVVGKSPLANGKKKAITTIQRITDKEPAIEVYDKGRYFAITGLRLRGQAEPQQRDEKLKSICDEYFKVEQSTQSDYVGYQSEMCIVDRARKYMATLPVSISGQGGHNAAFHAACVAVLGFGLDENGAMSLMQDWNRGCNPPWSERELSHKIRQAMKQPGERNYLRNTPDAKFKSITIPNYKLPERAKEEKKEAEVITVADAGRLYIAALRSGATELIQLGLGNVDYALGGGIAKGEYVAMAARPSHGKSMLAMQCVHQWAAQGLSSFVVSAEMSALALGKRVLHFVSESPEEDWTGQGGIEQLEKEIEYYEQTSAKSHIIAECSSADEVCDEIEKAIDKHGIKAAIVDYVQLLNAPGNTKSDKVAYTSGALKSLAKRRNLPMILLCQMGRGIEKRPQFLPAMSDLEHSSRIEQDADVILFLAWSHRLNKEEPKDKYMIWAAKNRNRPINEYVIECKLLANRQMVIPVDAPIPMKKTANRESTFDEWNNR